MIIFSLLNGLLFAFIGYSIQNYFEKKEQERLAQQAKFLEPYVYEGIDLEFKKTLLEVGCGVGAQTEILLRRFPDLHIDGVDLSESQLSIAQKVLKKERKLKI